MNVILAVDPGESTGFCYFDLNTRMPAQMGVVKKDDIWYWIDLQIQPQVWVVEDYKIRPNVKRWDSGFALQVIGAIKLQAHRLGVEVVLQQPSIKPVASGLTGYGYVKGRKGTHAEDAILHGAYYLHKH